MPKEIVSSIDFKDRLVPNFLRSEESQAVIEAEQIALLKLKLFKTTYSQNLPPQKWGIALKKSLRHYPNLEVYDELFSEALKKAWETDFAINQIQQEFNGNLASRSKELFATIFGIVPKEPVSITAKKQLLIFKIQKSDYCLLDEDLLDRNGNSRSSVGFFSIESYKDIKVPVIVLLADYSFQEKIYEHEKQHSQDYFQHSIIFNFNSRGKPQKLKKLSRRFGKEQYLPYGRAENEAKYEILANASLFDLCEKLNVAVEKSEILDELEQDLTDEQGVYYQQYVNRFELGLPEDVLEHDKYKERVSAGINSYLSLAEMYKNIFPGKTNRMAIEVLGQFPLENWPAVVRLISSRR